MLPCGMVCDTTRLACPCCGGRKGLSLDASTCAQCGWRVVARVASRWPARGREAWSALVAELGGGPRAERAAFERLRSEHD